MIHPGSSEEPLAALVRAGVLDAELAALAWLTAEAGIPFVVAGEPGTGRAALRDALVQLLPAGATIRRLAGEAETFGWMPEAVELGWRHEGPWGQSSGEAETADDGVAAGAGGPVVMVADLEPGGPGVGAGTGTWGERARVAIRAVAVGYGLAATAAVHLRIDRQQLRVEELGLRWPRRRIRRCERHFVARLME